MYRNSRKEILIWQVKNKWIDCMSYSAIASSILFHTIVSLLRYWFTCRKPKSYCQVRACCKDFFPALTRVHITTGHLYTQVSSNTEQMETYLMRQQIFDLTCIHFDDLLCKGNISLGNPEPWKRGGKIWLWKKASITALNSVPLPIWQRLSSTYSLCTLCDVVSSQDCRVQPEPMKVWTL